MTEDLQEIIENTLIGRSNVGIHEQNELDFTISYNIPEAIERALAGYSCSVYIMYGKIWNRVSNESIVG